MELHQAICERRTIHSFNSKKVPHQFLLKAIEAANFAPCHRLTFPWRFKLVNEEVRTTISRFAVSFKANGKRLDEQLESKIIAKYNTPSNLIIATQVISEDSQQKLEDYAACACAIQNLSLSLVSNGVGYKWSTGKIIRSPEVYNLLELNSDLEEIIGFIWVGYGDIPPVINRPKLASIFFDNLTTKT